SRASMTWPTISPGVRLRTSRIVPVWQNRQLSVQPTWLETHSVPPGVDAQVVVPEVLFMPLVGFTAKGDRLGQGGGYYDRYLAAHPAILAFGMAWDVQEVPELPIELHDMRLSAIITPTRVLGPFDPA